MECLFFGVIGEGGLDFKSSVSTYELFGAINRVEWRILTFGVEQ
uniref:Uncharacterized protein n=1 Tax=Lepeophtheirus salmonis TaxID=72036 RepID=A0A0K2TW54_LEPSM